VATAGNFSPLLCMQIPDSGVSAAPVLLVHPTGGGKSTVREVFSVLSGGFSLTITPLLSLGVNQEEKVSLRAKYTAGLVLAVHLDKIRSLADQQDLIKSFKRIPPDRHNSVLLFSSPQAILNKKFLWKEFIEWLNIVNDYLSLVYVDKVHLFVHFGMTFCDKFKLLTAGLFNRLKVGGSSIDTIEWSEAFVIKC
jgi:superfamily II DNA helicase RecQ